MLLGFESLFSTRFVAFVFFFVVKTSFLTHAVSFWRQALLERPQWKSPFYYLTV
jgi:hypothetical protein